MTDRFSNRPQRQASAHSAPVVDPEVPTTGCYRIRLAKGAPDSAIRIWIGYSIDPATGEEMTERSFHWQCTLNGVRVPLENYWPGCARDPISIEEHDAIVARNKTLDEDSPFYDPRKPIDLSRSPPPF
jgi:hypothetical protein